MYRKVFLVIPLVIFVFLSYSQTNIISDDYMNPTYVGISQDNQFELFYYNHSEGNDLPLPHMDRMYPGASSYFSFKVPQSGELTVKFEFQEETFFGAAFYTKNDEGNYNEIKWDAFKNTEAEMYIYTFDELAGQTILGRFWVLGDEPSSGEFELCIISEPLESFPKVIQVSSIIYNPVDLIYDVLISGCVEAYNVQYTGHEDAVGVFANGIPPFDFAEGVVMSTGEIYDIPGPNTIGNASTNLGEPGDADLSAIVDANTYDAAVLEFDFMPASNEVSFNYIFASDEYHAFANSNYNDVFAFLISGGPENYDKDNIALLPGTTTAVSINNVNNGNSNNGPCMNCEYFIANNSSPYISYDGMTVTLTAITDVTACEIYQMKLAIADVQDAIYDSAVFLERGSFASGEGIGVDSYNAWNSNLPVMQGCSNYLIFYRGEQSPSNDPVYIDVNIGGTAIPGVDYTEISNNHIIPAGEDSVVIQFDAYITGSSDPETIILYLEGVCPCDDVAEYIITIEPPFEIDPQLSSDPICAGETANIQLELNADDNDYVSVAWSTGSNSQTGIQVSPDVTTEYTVTITYPCDEIIISHTVIVNQNPVVDFDDITICEGEPLVLQGNPNGMEEYYWTGPNNFTSWEQNPSVSGSVTPNMEGTYTLSVTDINGCTGQSSVNIILLDDIDPPVSNTGPYCAGETIQLNTDSYAAYSWSGPAGFTSTNQNPFITDAQDNYAGEYIVTVTGTNGCTGTGSTIVELHPTPVITASNTGPYCAGQTISLSSSPGGMSSYSWSGPAVFSSAQQNPTRLNAQVNHTGEYSVTATNSFGCTGSVSTVVVVDQQVDATINNLDDVCFNNPPVPLNAQSSGGTWSGPGVVSGGMFYPSDAGVGTHTIYYEIINGACSDNDQTTITVFNNIFIENFNTECDDINENYFVSFDVVDNNGNPVGFYANGTSGSGSYSQMFVSETEFSITVTDLNNYCDEYIFNGFIDCGCDTYAGTMSSLSPILLCYGDCADVVAHNGNQFLDGNDALQFIIHDGSYPANILARSNTPVFCLPGVLGINLGQTYYISAIAGDDMGDGSVDTNDPCYSQSQGTPVIWYNYPAAHINTPNFSTCGFKADLSAVAAPDGVNGSWSCDNCEWGVDVWAINGTTRFDNDISILINEHGIYDFKWTLNNVVCTDSDIVTVEFLPTPSAYAGGNFAVCGNTAQLEAIPSLPGSIGQWSGGNGTFNPSTSPNAQVTIAPPYGSREFTWRETLGVCWTEDKVKVTFIQEPNPMIIPPRDTVCGNTHNLNVFNVQGTGSWKCYKDEIQVACNFNNPNNPNATVTVPPISGHYDEFEFVWTEEFQTAGIVCEGSATQTVLFARNPVANVGSPSTWETCGDCFTFYADTTGSGWATGTWINTHLLHEFTDNNPNLPNSEVCINPLGSYGDSAYVKTTFTWIMDNFGCTSSDNMTVTFYKRPKANAGLDNAVCGRNYQLGAVYNLPESPNYTSKGNWSEHKKPDEHPGAIANISPNNKDSVNVTVTHHGIWEFLWEEYNENLANCRSYDTVTIEFVEVPVIDAGDDFDVCGKGTQLQAVSAGFPGNWLDNGAVFTDPSDPTTDVIVNAYGALNFIWMEFNFAETTSLLCSSLDTVTATFWEVPTAVIFDDLPPTACGLRYNHLRAMQPPPGVKGVWWCDTDPDAEIDDPNSHNTFVNVSNYGYHDFYWILSTGPTYQPNFCNDTAGPLTVHFIEKPVANAGGDTLFCGLKGNLNAISSAGTGSWSTPSPSLISFDEPNNPNTLVESQVYSSSTQPYFDIIWIEDNHGCTDKDTIKVVFARIPSSEFAIVPPKCLGEQAILSASDTTLVQYDWNFYTGIVDTVDYPPVSNSQGGFYEYFVYWTHEDTAHRVSLTTTNHWGCKSLTSIDTVAEPAIPDFDVVVFNDTCLLGRGAIKVEDTTGLNAFYWMDSYEGWNLHNMTKVPPYDTLNPGASSITIIPDSTVSLLPAGAYDIRVRYRTPNQQWYGLYISIFGNAMCTDTVRYFVEPTGLLEAKFEIPADILYGELVAPEAEVMFINLSDYGGVRRRCVWNFGDGNTSTSCDDHVIHIYTEAGCYEPFLIIMNRDLQECRDTAFLDFCIQIDKHSELEVPNIFTPDGDGINDFFQVKAQSLRTFQGYIVNRWGKVIYEWTNWQDMEAGWDGKHKGGSDASSGVYFYIIKAEGMDDVEYDFQGPLHLMR